MGSQTAASVTAEVLTEQAESLAQALDLASAVLEPAAVDLATRLVGKVRERTSIAGDHTVVALAGATGSGKSSLFNALIGEPVAAIGARRPTTSTPTAAIWGPSAATELLDWLHIHQRHAVATSDRVAADGAGQGTTIGSLQGLVLLDLPDFDSRVAEHRQEAQRILELVDVFVWVTDPQKYADALLHDDYVRALATHDAVTLIVLNQADRLTPSAVEMCRNDLRRLAQADGLTEAQVLVTSASTGAGIDELRQRLANVVAGASAARQRLSADIVSVATRLRAGVNDNEIALADDADAALVDALARAAGVPVVVDAVREDYRRASAQSGGWLFTRWMSAFRADRLARLHLDKVLIRSSVQESEIRAVVGRSSIPPPSPAARSAVSLALRELADRAGGSLPVRWSQAVTDAATPEDHDLSDDLDQAVLHTPLRTRNPVWWTVMGGLQWLLGSAAVVGLLWLVVISVAGWLQLPELPAPTLGPLAWPFVLFGAGVLLGLVAAAITRAVARAGAARRAAQADHRLREAIHEVTVERIVGPVVAVLERHRRTRELLDRARLAR